jgi:hypothetical protein
MLSNKRGITLVALVITIIVLLILAGVSLAMALGNNGVLTRSSEAVVKTDEATAVMDVKVAYAAVVTDYFADIVAQGKTDSRMSYVTEEKLQNEIGNLGEISNFSKDEAKGEITLDYTPTGKPTTYSLIIDELGEVVIEGSSNVQMAVDTAPGVLEQENGNYVISCIEDLVAFSYDVCSGTLYEDKTVSLGRNLDFKKDSSYANPSTKYVRDSYGYKPDESGRAIKEILNDTSGEGFIPVGDGSTAGFSGTFDGKNYSINHLYINNDSGYVGFFGRLTNSFTIRNVKILNCNVTGGSRPVGGVIGFVDSSTNPTGLIENVGVSGTISGSDAPAGGIAGEMAGTSTINNCYSTANISSNNLGGGICGSLIGNATIVNCYNTGKVDSDLPAGGIIGGNGSMSVTPGPLTIMNCYNLGDISGPNSNAGGIIGFIASASSVIKNCFNSGSIIGREVGGGIIGNFYEESGSAEVANCYNTGSVYALNVTGGMAGGTTYSGVVLFSNCYNSGHIETPADEGYPVGGILGYGPHATFANCHNSGDIVHTGETIRFGEIVATGSCGSDCTYLIKENNANANGARGVTDITDTMSMSNFVSTLNDFVAENNSDVNNVKLHSWTLSNGKLVFVTK